MMGMMMMMMMNEDDEDDEGTGGNEPGPARVVQLESFRISNAPGACLFLAKARATSASTDSFRDNPTGFSLHMTFNVDMCWCAVLCVHKRATSMMGPQGL